MRICLPIFLVFVLASCEQKQEVTQDSTPASKDLILQDESLLSIYGTNMEDYTGIPADLLPPYFYRSVQRDGNNEYIYVLGEDKTVQWAILIYSSTNLSKQAFQIYKETPTEGGVKRSPITDKELATHLDIIEKKLIDHYGQAVYSRFYTGGLPEEDEEEALLISLEPREQLSLDDIEQRAAENLGEETLYNIAHLIHYLRATLNSR